MTCDGKEGKRVGTYLPRVPPVRRAVVRGMIWERAKVAKGRTGIKRLVVRTRRIIGTGFMLCVGMR